MTKQEGQWVPRRLTNESNMSLAEPVTLGVLKRAFDKGPKYKAPGVRGIVQSDTKKRELLKNPTKIEEIKEKKFTDRN